MALHEVEGVETRIEESTMASAVDQHEPNCRDHRSDNQQRDVDVTARRRRILVERTERAAIEGVGERHQSTADPPGLVTNPVTTNGAGTPTGGASCTSGNGAKPPRLSKIRRTTGAAASAPKPDCSSTAATT